MAAFAGVLPVVRFYQTAPGPGQSCAYRAYRESRLTSDLGIAEARVPEEQDLPVSGRQGDQRFVHRGDPLIVLDHGVSRRGYRGLGHRIGFEQGKVSFPADCRPGFVPRQIGGHRENPGAGFFGLVRQGPDKDFLRQVLGTLRVPNLAVQEAHNGRISGLVQLLELVRRQYSLKARDLSECPAGSSKMTAHPVELAQNQA